MFLGQNSFLYLFAILLIAGCGSSAVDDSEEARRKRAGGELKETVAVSGKVSLAGQPAGKVTLQAYTQESGMEPAAQCLTNADGTYCWNTYGECDGLVPGSYRLAFKKAGARQKPGARDQLGGKYLNPLENDFPLEVVSGEPQTEVNYNLE